MANVFAADATNKLLHTGEYGNAVTYVYEADVAANSGDVIYLGKIPAGTRVTDVRWTAEDTGSTSTIDLGYLPADGATPAAAQSYWFNDYDTSGAATDTRSASRPIRFERDVWLTVLVNSANFTGTPLINVTVYGVNEGVK